MTTATDTARAALARVFDAIGPVAVAVSGGVDSMTLAFMAHRHSGSQTSMFHARSPAVPPEATMRVRAYGERYGWDLRVIDAGEFQDADYLRNPIDRCFFCKHNLYQAISRLTPATLVSGANLDDLSDYRPGLRAAERHAVRHPYIEAGVSKSSVRALARKFGLDDLAELPASPCLSSRIETGIAVSVPALKLIHAAESLLRDELRSETVRCRVRAGGIAVELDEHGLERFGQHQDLLAKLARLCAAHGYPGEVRFEPYRRGSAFLRASSDG
ncbi:MAG: asparagine synthase-related protein [Gammaproteobacteria bacterium]